MTRWTLHEQRMQM